MQILEIFSFGLWVLIPMLLLFLFPKGGEVKDASRLSTIRNSAMSYRG